MSSKSSKNTKDNPYQKLINNPGIYKHRVTGHYLARKKIKGINYKETFKTLRQANNWRHTFNGTRHSENKNEQTHATLKEVWKEMQKSHFPTLAKSTQAIWQRRYILLQELENHPMNLISPSVITSWVEKQVKLFKSDEYEQNCRGHAKRCNLNNELNLFVTIFNWYKESELFEQEAANLTNPVKTKHKKKGFIRPKPVKRMGITLKHALLFFELLEPLYRDLALTQYFTASRIGEVAGLQWHRIDFINRRFVIMETCHWDMTSKCFVELNKQPKNKEPRPVYMTDELFHILKRRETFKVADNDFVFHVEGKPLNYGTIQLNYRKAQRKGNLPYSGTHILRHGMAKLARKVGGGLDAVIAMTGHKDFKLADHYSKLDEDHQKEVSEKIMQVIRQKQQNTNCGKPVQNTEHENVIKISDFVEQARVKLQ